MGPVHPLAWPRAGFDDFGIDFGLILKSFFMKKHHFSKNVKKHITIVKQIEKQGFAPSNHSSFRSDFKHVFTCFLDPFQKYLFVSLGPPQGAKK